MIQWILTFDMFWCKYIGNPEWFYISEKHRGSGICASLFSAMCARVKESGGKAVFAFANKNTYKLMERISFGDGKNSVYHLSGQAFDAVCQLNNKGIQEMVRCMPEKSLNLKEVGDL